MADATDLMEAIAAAALDGLTLTFGPADVDGTGLSTGLVVEVRHGAGGADHRHALQVGFDQLLASGAPERVLCAVIADTAEPVVDRVLAEQVAQPA